MLRLLGLVLPLCLDTFAVAAAIGLRGVTPRQRLRLGLLFAAFEGGMPLIGLGAGAGLGRLMGSFADYLAAAALVGLGVYLLAAGEEAEERRLARLPGAGGWTLIGLGLSISLDELAIGFSLGLAGVSIALAVILIAVQALAVSQLGFSLGGRIGDRLREGAERLAALVLLALGAVLLAAKLTALPV